jgi:UDP-N-acetylmuramoyl-L-alanyl-D-glutamate--2,6-diaminopimelate ligase
MLSMLKNLVPQSARNKYHLVRAIGANMVYGWPSKNLKVIGVTGTDGKTTTTSLIYHILISSGKKASMVSTVYAKIGAKEYDTGLHTTTPDSKDVQKFLKRSVEAGDEYFILETTSMSLDQNRDWGITFEVGVITNITHEHMDYHKTYDNYVKAKAKLLLRSKKPVINRDDSSYKPLSVILNKAGKSFQTYALQNKADFQMDISEKIDRPLPEFNKYNFLAAYGVCRDLGISEEEIFSALKTFKLPIGRMEVVYNKDFAVIVDFAHTPNAMFELLKGVKTMFPQAKRIINVFGSAGRRDATKRPAMGEASGTFSDMTIITEDDPRDEGAENIAKSIAEGLQKKGFKEVRPEEFGHEGKTYTVITDRRAALEKALSLAQIGDVLVFNGKGHEKSIARAHGEDPWSDQEETQALLSKLGKAN